MTTITIRHSTPEDINAIVALYQQPSIYANTLQLPHPSTEKWKSFFDSLPENFYSLVAEIDGKIVGQLGMEVFTRPRRKHVANLGMGVCESARGQGVGKVLLKEAQRLAHDWLAVSRIEIEVYTDNHSAIALYKSCGFEMEGTAKKYAFRDGEYVDAYYMASLSN
ncbi:GNAT family N-acetyltransferase [Parashewanella curva]|uniref:GNAT family N-acetyltransferase n=1 Tax=Parashewanella curva TaxID=2338552 RepID=A0A3L8Q2C7_9GAMM|nr:GNAT family N-acetyltransferase [Parashewanella curva]RLV61674.1 GNAT family N-acetyltransferase [Parashewanella curva]